MSAWWCEYCGSYNLYNASCRSCGAPQRPLGRNKRPWVAAYGIPIPPELEGVVYFAVLSGAPKTEVIKMLETY